MSNITNLPFLDPSFVGTSWTEIYWKIIVDTFGSKYIVVAFYLFMTICYLLSGGFFWILEQFRVLPQYRLQPGKWPKNEDYVKTLKNIFMNYLVIILPMCFIAPTTLETLGISAYGPLPTWKRLLVDLVFCMLVEDFFQYILHRMLHWPSLYPYIHKVHHEWTAPFALAASYAHPAEILILAIAAFAGPFFCRPHMSSFFVWLLFRQLDAVKTHSGWVWPGLDHLLRFVPTYEGALFHDYHHRSFIWNYASRFAFIDVAFGTYKAPPVDPLNNMEAVLAASKPKKIRDDLMASMNNTNIKESPFQYKVKAN